MRELNGLYWLNVAFGALLIVAIAAGAAHGVVYAEPRVTPLDRRPWSVTFLFGGYRRAAQACCAVK